MKRSIRKGALIAIPVLLVGVGGAYAAGAPVPFGDDDETAITGSARIQAIEAALDHVGEGTAIETEVGDEESMYEVEVRKDDGSSVDVQLDESFEVVGSETDDENEDEGDEDEGTR